MLNPDRASIKKRSTKINGQLSSVTLEDEFWEALIEIANAQERTLADLITSIDSSRTQGNLSSAIRRFVLAEARGGRLGPTPTERPIPLSRTTAR
jgi:predicted DNA-binding ribbon-helix-helix protein